MNERELIQASNEPEAIRYRIARRLTTIADVRPDRLHEFDALSEASWEQILQTLGKRDSLFDVDWSAPFAQDTESSLLRLASLKVTHPEDNIDVKKLMHNVSVENYIKLALETAGDVSNLRIFLELVRAKLEADPASTVLAEQALLIWVPAAEIAGLSGLKTRLEEAAFASLYPEEKRLIDETYAHLGGNKALSELIKELEHDIGYLIKDELPPGVKVAVSGRRKSDYSIWRKVTKDARPSYSLTDYLASRGIVSSEDEEQNVHACYAIRDVLNQFFPFEPDRYKDYIQEPQPNGYRAIHLTFMYKGTPVEFQVKTLAMHNEMEMDLSKAHIIYDAAKKVTPGTYYQPGRENPLRIYKWRSAAQQQINERLAAGDESLQNLLPGKIVVFAYDGNLYEVNQGDTALDFALAAIHTEFVFSVRSIFVNRMPAAFDQPLKRGQVIRVHRERNGKDMWKDSWATKLNSAEAKRRLRKAQHERDHAIHFKNGLALLTAEFSQKGWQNLLPRLTDKDKSAITKAVGQHSFDVLIRNVGIRAGLRPEEKRFKEFGVEGIANKIARQLGIDPTPAKAEPSAKELKKAAANQSYADRGHTYVLAIHGSLRETHRIADCCPRVTVGTSVKAVYSRMRGMFSLHYPECVNIGDRQAYDCTWHQVEENKNT